MKHPILQLFIALSLVVLTGCTSFPSDGNGVTKTETEITTETTSESEESPEMIGLSYYFHHGSMAGMDYNYSILKKTTGTYQFHAELESGFRTVDKEISQEDFDAIMKLANDSVAAQTSDESAYEGLEEYAALDADSFGFEATYEDGDMQPIDFGQANNEILSQLKNLLDE